MGATFPIAEMQQSDRWHKMTAILAGREGERA
jgi:hypothetical protein